MDEHDSLEFKKSSVNKTKQVNKSIKHKYERLAYTKKISEILFVCNINNLKDELSSFDFMKIYNNSFSLRVYELKETKEKPNDFKIKIFERIDLEKKYSKYIWENLKNQVEPRVDLEKPKTPIEIILINDIAVVCLKLWQNDSEFNKRKAHLRAEKHPTAMHPKMACALINILNPEKSIIDPFCGAGGILLEAAIMNIKSQRI
ncbi:MAG: hypothetical protein KatS3mg002_1619 [Candidatus Woesearchaeota archaeon]|nr:MAG: hypothetical protein KatS3mg002_1619 [Candidatus Woesearchaeota archaeon]